MNCYQAAPSRWLSISNSALPQLATHSWFSLQSQLEAEARKHRCLPRQIFEDKHRKSSCTLQMCLQFFLGGGGRGMRTSCSFRNENARNPKGKSLWIFTSLAQTRSRTISKHKWSNASQKAHLSQCTSICIYGIPGALQLLTGNIPLPPVQTWGSRAGISLKWVHYNRKQTWPLRASNSVACSV